MFKDSLKHFIINASLIFPLSFEAARKDWFSFRRKYGTNLCQSFLTLMPGGNKKVTYLNLQLKAAGLSKCVTFLLPPGIKRLTHENLWTGKILIDLKKLSLREKCPNMDQKLLRIWTLFTLAEIRIVEGRADFEWKYKTTRSGFLWLVSPIQHVDVSRVSYSCLS